MRTLRPSFGWLCFAILPVTSLVLARDTAMGLASVDLGGHLWMIWNAAQGELPVSSLVEFPFGFDLIPMAGGWLDILLAAPLAVIIGPILAYNLVLAAYLILAGVGGAALARSVGATPAYAIMAGLLLQLDGFVLHHANSGRPEQAALGLVALALAYAIHAWNRERTSDAIISGLCGGLVIWASWELTVLLAAATLFLVPLLGKPTAGGLRRWCTAALVTSLIGAPWVAFFALHVHGVRAMDEGDFALGAATDASMTLAGVLDPRTPRASLLALVAIPCAAFLDRSRRRFWLGIAVGCLIVGVLALGPQPRLMGPPSAEATPWGPFYWVTRLPVLGWFHWPDRLLCLVSLAAVAATGRVLPLLRRPPLFASLVLAGALIETSIAHRWPPSGPTLDAPEPVHALARSPRAGAVLNLPIHEDAPLHLFDQQLQIHHGRPIRFSMFLPHLHRDNTREASPIIDWFHDLMGEKPPPAATFEPADFAELERQGFSFITLSQFSLPRPHWRRAHRVLTSHLGPPRWEDKKYAVWEIPTSEP